MSLYKGLSFKSKIHQWHILHTRVWRNRFRRCYDAVYVRHSTARWARSEFPHSLVTLDFDEGGNLIGVEIIGRNLKAEVS